MSPNPAVLTWPRPVAGGPPSPSYTYLANATTGGASTTTSRTFSSLSLGTPAANRSIIVASHGRGTGGQPATAVTVGGVSATQVASFVDGVSSVAIWVAAVPSGATGNVVLTYAASSEAQAVGLWATYGTLAYSTHGTNGNGGISVTLTAPSNCLAIAARTAAAASGFGTAYTGLTEDYRHPSTNYSPAAGASGQPAAGSFTVSDDSTSGSNNAGLVVAFTLT